MTKTITISDDDGDELKIDFGTIITWVDADKTCLVFTDYNKLLELADAIIKNKPL